MSLERRRRGAEDGGGSVRTRQPLNPVDCAMRCADLAIRECGYPGLETQMLVWFDGPVRMDALRSAIAQFGHRYPVTVSRLIEPDGAEGRSPYWQFQPGASGELEEAVLSADSRDAVLEHAAKLFSTTQDLAKVAPLRFYLLHRPGGRDVLLLQYNHVLMDNRATARLLPQIAALAGDEGFPIPAARQGDPILRHLRQFPCQRRREAVAGVLQLHRRLLRGKAITLPGDASAAVTRPATLGIAARRLSLEHSQAFRSRVIAVCGFPSLSMAILCSAFRAVDHLTPVQRTGHRPFVAGIGIALDSGGLTAPAFQNLTSLVPIHAARDHMRDRDQLLRMLSAQMRQQLAEDVDLGYLRLTALFSRRPRLVHWVVEHMLLWGYSLWYAYFGSQDSAGDELFGAKIEDISYTGPVWSSTGLTLLASQYRGRLTMQATYDSSIVPVSLANEFLDFVEADLPC